MSRTGAVENFFNKAAQQHHPLRALTEFLEREKQQEQSKKYEEMRFVGYVLDISYDQVVIITSDPFKIAVGGVPRNSLLIMTPAAEEKIDPPHFTVLRVLDAAPTPLSKEVQQTYFELQKKSMPELDVFTQSELQWGALKTEVLGMFYPHPEKQDAVEFAGDMNNFVSAHKYRVYAPDEKLLDIIVNSLVPQQSYRFLIGWLRLTECRLPFKDKPTPKVPVYVSPEDFLGARTAMFGKTRLGKSNVVKLIAQSIIDYTEKDRRVGQLIFDINGEYANDNPQDGSRSLRSANPCRCTVYAISPKQSTPSKPLKLNFYEHPEIAIKVISNLLAVDKRNTSQYVQRFMEVELCPISELENVEDISERTRLARRIQIFWAILHKAGYPANERKLAQLLRVGNTVSGFNPKFKQEHREKYDQRLDEPSTLAELVQELEQINKLRKNGEDFKTTSGNSLFNPDDEALLEFLFPSSVRTGAPIIQPYRKYHDPRASDFTSEIIQALEDGKTVILDLGNADPTLMEFFSDQLSKSVFNSQVEKFSNDQLGNKYIQFYFEEAHNLFPRQKEPKDIYSRLAKEGAKYHIGMVYSTQSPSTISGDLLAQTENFFVAHISSQEEVNALAKMNYAYESVKDDILRTKTPGYIRMLTRSHRFVIPVQAIKFEPPVRDTGGQECPIQQEELFQENGQADSDT